MQYGKRVTLSIAIRTIVSTKIPQFPALFQHRATASYPFLNHHTASSTMATMNWRTINIDALDPESSTNFDITTLTPSIPPISASDVQNLAGQIKQLLRGGDAEMALRGALDNVPYGGDSGAKVRNISKA